MRGRVRTPLAAAGIVLAAQLISAAWSQQPPQSAGTGSPDVLINGKPAQRAGDPTSTATSQGSANVLINGKPAISGGCPAGSVPIASPNVFVNGKPAIIGCSN